MQHATTVPHKVTPRDALSGETSIEICDWKISSKKQRMLDTLEMEQYVGPNILWKRFV